MVLRSSGSSIGDKNFDSDGDDGSRRDFVELRYLLLTAVLVVVVVVVRVLRRVGVVVAVVWIGRMVRVKVAAATLDLRVVAAVRKAIEKVQ